MGGGLEELDDDADICLLISFDVGEAAGERKPCEIVADGVRFSNKLELDVSQIFSTIKKTLPRSKD